jgi:hypothetical protein
MYHVKTHKIIPTLYDQRKSLETKVTEVTRQLMDFKRTIVRAERGVNGVRVPRLQCVDTHAHTERCYPKTISKEGGYWVLDECDKHVWVPPGHHWTKGHISANPNFKRSQIDSIMVG